MSYPRPAGRVPAGAEPARAAGTRPEAAAAASVPHGSLGVSVLFREHHADLVRLAVLLVGDQPSAEDVVQDVFARLCLRPRLPAGAGSLAYVRAAVLNGCRST